MPYTSHSVAVCSVTVAGASSLVGAVGYAFDPSVNRVRGLRVEASGAAGLLAAMGLVVED